MNKKINKRTIGATLGLERAKIIRDVKLTQGDRKSHVICVGLGQDIEIENYELLVFYSLPLTAQISTVVDKYELKDNNVEVYIPDLALKRTGTLTVEFALKHMTEDRLLTISEKLELEVIGTINGAILEALPGENIQLHIDQQLEKIDELLKQADNKITEYNNNATSKTEQYNNNSTEKFNSFNQNYDEKLKSFNQNDTQKTSAFNDNATKKLKEYNDNDALKTQNYNNNAEEKKSEFNNNATQVANKFTDYVNSTLNTVTTEIDRRAKASANAAGERANQEVKNQEGLSVQAVTNEGTKQVDLVVTKGTEEIEKVQAAGTQAVSDINANKDAHVKAVTDEGNKQVLAVGNKGTEEVSKVQSAGAKAVEDVNANKTANIQAVTEEGTKQIGLVRTEGEEQIGLVVDKGTEQTTAIGNKGTEEASKVTGEGSKQIKAVQNQGTVSLEAIINIQKQIEQLLKNQEAIGNALALNGKTGIQYDKEIQSVAGMNFDPDLQYLNDAGTKKVGFCYLDRLTDGIFECIKQTTAVVNDSACFRNFSNKENSDRLSNKLDFDANAVSASKLAKPVRINGVPFDGSEDILIGSSAELTNIASYQEVENLLIPEILKDYFELANEEDVKMMFKNSSYKSIGTYDLSNLTPDESKIVNMKLLSFYNDLLSQKFNSKIDKSLVLNLGKGLNGSPDFSKNSVSISLNIATDEEIEKMLEGGSK